MDNSTIAHSQVSVIILAAGLSTRMHEPKLVLPWGNRTILGTVITAFRDAGVDEVVVVTGGSKDLIEHDAAKYQARCAFNANFANGEMADSLKTGLAAVMKDNLQATFVALADHPFIASYDIVKMIELFEEQKAKLIVPSQSMHKGHPWLISRDLWLEIMKLQPPDTMREFINAHNDEIVYYVVEKSRILEDLDTPEDYQRLRPENTR